MKIHLIFQGQIKTILKQADTSLTLPENSTIYNLLSELPSHLDNYTQHPFLNTQEELQSSILMFQGDKQIPRWEIHDTILKDKDIITFMSPLAGG